MAENPILIEKEQDKENFRPPNPTTPISKRPTQPPLLIRSRPVGTRIKRFSSAFIEFYLINLYVCYRVCILS